MRSPVDISALERQRRSLARQRSGPSVGITVITLTGIAVLGLIGARALSRDSGGLRRGLRRVVDVLGAGDGAADESYEIVGRTVTINRPRHELYAFWRDFRNLPQIMENIESVTVVDERRSHWVIRAPAGTTVEWDSEIVDDVPGERIGWTSAESADVPNSGRIEFQDAPGGRGTLVSATIVYDPPAGDVGKMIAKLFQREPNVQARRDLRRFKQLMETGEIATPRMNTAAFADPSFADPSFADPSFADLSADEPDVDRRDAAIH
jgi:uncharacterized membrane protein